MIFKVNSKEEKSLVATTASREEFNEIVADIIFNPNVMALKEHLQHQSTSRFDHCISVSFITYSICKRLGLDYVSAARRSNAT